MNSETTAAGSSSHTSPWAVELAARERRAKAAAKQPSTGASTHPQHCLPPARFPAPPGVCEPHRCSGATCTSGEVKSLRGEPLLRSQNAIMHASGGEVAKLMGLPEQPKASFALAGDAAGQKNKQRSSCCNRAAAASMADPTPELVTQCLRPGHCPLPDGGVRDWLHRQLLALGHASNNLGHFWMARTWFDCSFAVTPGASELMSSANMRLKLGELVLVQQLYERIVRMDLTKSQRKLAESKLREVASLRAGQHLRASSAASSELVPPATPLNHQEQLAELLTAPATVAKSLPPRDAELLLMLLRFSGAAACKAADFAAAQLWYDGCFAVSASAADMLAGASMRVRLDPVCAGTRPSRVALHKPQSSSPAPAALCLARAAHH